MTTPLLRCLFLRHGWSLLLYIVVAAPLISPVSAADHTAEAVIQHWKNPTAFYSSHAVTTPSEMTASSCGECHTEQYGDWRGSRHGMAFSPGLLARLLEFSDEGVTACLRCHAPLLEQQRSFLHLNTWQDQPDHGQWPTLLAEGVSCPACHLRNRRLVVSTNRRDHGDPVDVSFHTHTQHASWFSQSHFCANCHQSKEKQNAPLLNNTFEEWRESPFAAQKISCQDCHMPNHKHLFRGIHDADMVRSGITITVASDAEGLRLSLRSVRVGHRFPTYSVPRVLIQGWRLNQSMEHMDNHPDQMVIQHQLQWRDGKWQELADTRIRHGDSVSLAIPWKRDDRHAAAIRYSILVQPDHLYGSVIYPLLLTQIGDTLIQTLLKKAIQIARDGEFVLCQGIATRFSDNRPDHHPLNTPSPPVNGGKECEGHNTEIQENNTL